MLFITVLKKIFITSLFCSYCIILQCARFVMHYFHQFSIQHIVYNVLLHEINKVMLIYSNTTLIKTYGQKYGQNAFFL